MKLRDAGDQRDHDVADHVSADLVDHHVTPSLPGAGAAVGNSRTSARAQPGQVGHEVDREHDDQQRGQQRTEEPLPERERVALDPVSMSAANSSTWPE